MLAPAALIQLFAPWKELFDSSTTLQVALPAIHVASLLLGGGLAVSTDRGTLRCLSRPPAERLTHLEELNAVHRFVLIGLALSFASGVLLLASDVQTFLGSKLFWLKLTLVLLLLGNGFLMTRAERELKEATDNDGAWARLRRAAIASFVLWFAVAIAGVAVRETV